MNRALTHRGPDDAGQFDDEECRGSLAMRRLSIIDLTTGHQPIFNEDQTKVIVFNGEIYNFQGLRKELEGKGHRFQTSTDTEVILHLFEEDGDRAPERLHGMFAFAIYDRRASSLFLARDRFGEKPLYYSTAGGDFAFSSEIESLLEWPGVARRLDYEALYYLLHLGYIPAPLTLFESIRQLPAGHTLQWAAVDGRFSLRSYYQPVYVPDSGLNDDASAHPALWQSLLEAVRSQMVADVPLGAFLSGGIDSSTVVAAMQQVSSKPVKTFTVRFEHAASDESPVARAVAKHLGTDHHEFFLANRSFDDEDLWRIVRRFGQPFLDSSAIPTYFISREIRSHVTVALSGDGGDEIFAGYRYFPEALAVDRISALPGFLLAAGGWAAGLASGLPLLEEWPMLRKARRVAEVAQLPGNRRPGAFETLFDAGGLGRIASPALQDRWRNVSDTMTEKILDSVHNASRLRQLMHYRVKYSLAEDMLPKVDRMSMASSLEVRAPLLSAEVTDFALRLPERQLIRRGVKKFALREAGRKYLPAEVYSHPKSGFTIPLHMFHNEKYSRLCETYLAGGASPFMSALFNREAVQAVVAAGQQRHFQEGHTSVHRATHQLWGLLQLSAWAEVYGIAY